MSIRARKRFGQNFLQDPFILAQIFKSLDFKPQDKVLEIGPGMGALTGTLLQQLPQLTVIEIDFDLEAYLLEKFAHFKGFQLIRADALAFDYSLLGKDLRVLGNLPYNIATPLILRLLSLGSAIRDMHFMVQKEVALRLASEPGSKNYGRLSVMVQYHCAVDYLFEVPPQAFSPVPKVDSAFVRLRPHTKSPYPSVDVALLESTVAMAFAMRRKTLANNLKPLVSAAALTEIGIEPGLRAEQLSVLDYIKIVNLVSKGR